MEIKWSVASSLSAEARDHTIPLVEAAQDIAADIRRRVSTRGEAADGGQFSPYVAKNMTRATRDERGRFNGREAKKPRDFTVTGELWSSLLVNATTPGRAVIRFKGKRQNHGEKNALTNPQIAWLHQRREAKQILAPSASEQARFVQHIADLSAGQWLKALPTVAGNHKTARKEASAARAVLKAQRLQAQLRAAGVAVEGRAA